MDAPETSGNRIGRTIWTVWGYLSGAVAKYLRPEVTDEGNQSVCSRSDEIDLSAANKINREVKANSNEKEDNKSNHNDKSTGEVKCSPPEVRVQVASVQWENTDEVKDDKNDELHVDTARKQTYHCAMWSAETDHEGSISGDSESRGCRSGMHVEKEAVSSDEGQPERVYANSKDSEIVQELDETGRIEQKDGNNEEYDQKYENENSSKKREDPDNADVTVQSELYRQDVEQEKQMNMMDHGETECIGGFKHSAFIDEMEKKTVGLKDRVETEIDEDQGPELQVPADAFVLAVQDLLPDLEYSAEEDDGISKPERLKVMEKYSDEIAEFCKNEVEEMIPENRGATESEQHTIKSELQESAETLQRVAKEKNILNIQTELKMTSVLDEFFETANTPEDFLQLDSKQDTPENTSETGTGLPVVAIKTEGVFSNLIVCEFPGESRKRPETALGCFEEIKTEPQNLAEEQTEKETFVAHSFEHPETPKAVEEAVEIEQDIETPIESLGATGSQTHQEIDITKFSLKKHVELKTELIVETTEIKISSEDEEAEPFETQSQSSNIRTVTLQTHELLEFTERESKSSQEIVDTFSESLVNSIVSEITGTAEIQHVAEDQTDAKPVLTRTLSPAEFLEETLDLHGEPERCVEEQETLDTDVVKTPLKYVEEITNQVLKEMIEMEINLVKETETLEVLSTEELGGAEYQGPEECVSVGAFVLEEERKLLGETMGSIMEVETTSREVAKQNEQDIISQECETTEADQQTYLCAETDHGGSSSCDTESDTHVENEAVSSNEGQTERVHANSECKESETALELDKTGQIEQKDDNDEEFDQNPEDEKCEIKSDNPDNAEVIVQSELYGQDVEQEKQMNMMDHGETESSGGFRHAGEHLIDEKEKNNVDQNDHQKTEIDEDQGPELQVPVGAFVLEEEGKLLGETMEVENASSEVCETTEADQQTYLCAETDHGGSSSCDTESDSHVENEAVSSNEGQTERVHANSECKESETALELDKTRQIEQTDDNDEEFDQNPEDEKCEMKSDDPDNAEVIVQSELYGQDVEQEKQMNMMDHGETESSGGFRHAGEHLIDEKEKNNVDQNDHQKTEIDEDQGPELQVPVGAFVLEEEGKLLGETMEVENASSEVVKQFEVQSSPECETSEADGRHDQIQKAIAGETELSGHEDFMEISRPGMKRGFDGVSKDLPVVKIEGKFDFDLQAFEDSSLDFTIQKSRIAVKNPLVRPPKDPRKLLYNISVEPRLPQPPPCEVSVQRKGGIGFKLPGLGAGLPALRKTEFGKKAREEGEAERTLHPQQKSVAVTEDSVKQEQASAKPKWTPPKYPGMGSPLMMAELKNKLKKPVKE
ncbi:uncharacterized protein LOC143733090 isoform X2 [Siphateles boraxobius]|uniref:uncharacterized protein LOC143733090 isoform X2 n=1 Tax=Siphateles boraxobius TaxID=180520 RepID=UPI004062D257